MGDCSGTGESCKATVFPSLYEGDWESLHFKHFAALNCSGLELSNTIVVLPVENLITQEEYRATIKVCILSGIDTGIDTCLS